MQGHKCGANNFFFSHNIVISDPLCNSSKQKPTPVLHKQSIEETRIEFTWLHVVKVGIVLHAFSVIYFKYSKDMNSFW